MHVCNTFKNYHFPDKELIGFIIKNLYVFEFYRSVYKKYKNIFTKSGP